MRVQVLRRTLGFPVLAVLLGAATCAPSSGGSSSGPSGGTAGAAASRPVLAATPALPPGLSIPDVAERSVDSVVNISTTRVRRLPGGPGSPFEDPMFRFFFGPGFGPRPPLERREKSLGSGVIVREDGLILTNNHVVENADDIVVTLNGGRNVEAEVVGGDPKSDLALIRLEEKVEGLRPMPFGSSEELRLGETVLAIGNPFGLDHTVTMGIVSAKGRAQVGILDYENFIQTDAAINPGNSGGALINTRGELVGINTAIVSRTGGYQGIGFAIPVDMAKVIMKSLLEHGEVRRGWLGVAIQDLDPTLAESLGLKVSEGILISDVMDDSPAAEAGLERGDVVVSLGGRPVRSAAELRNAVALTAPGTVVEVGIIRDGERRTVEVKLGQLSDEGGRGPARPGDEDGALSGVKVQPLTPELRRRLDLPPDLEEGMVITRVAPGSIAAAAGLERGDVLLEVNRRPVRTPRDFEEAYERSPDSVLLLVWRNGHTFYMVLKK